MLKTSDKQNKSEQIIFTSKNGKKRVFDRSAWKTALELAQHAIRGKEQTIEDKAVELLCTNQALQQDRQRRFDALQLPTTQEIDLESRKRAFDQYVYAYLQDHSHYSDTYWRAIMGRSMSSGMEAEYMQAMTYAADAIKKQGYTQLSVAAMPVAREAEYLAARLGMSLPVWLDVVTMEVVE